MVVVAGVGTANRMVVAAVKVVVEVEAMVAWSWSCWPVLLSLCC